MTAWARANEQVRETRHARETRVLAGAETPRYRFDHGVLDDRAVHLDGNAISIGGVSVNLDQSNPFADFDPPSPP